MFCYFLFSEHAHAAILFTSPHKNRVVQGDSFLVDMRLDSENQVINTLEARLIYPKDKLEAVDVSSGGSLFTVWPSTPTLDKEAGVVSLVGGIPNGSLVANSLIAKITFRAKEVGETEIKFDELHTNIYLNDGLGTKAQVKTLSSKYSIEMPSAFSLTINSTSHPNKNQWYQESTFSVDWEEKPDALYSYILTQDQLVEPDEEAEVDTGELSFPHLDDGIYFFAIKEKVLGEGWSSTTRRRAMIDKTPPESFTPVIAQQLNEYGGLFFATFATIDLMSGIDEYQVKDGDALYRNLSSPYVLQDQSLTKSILVRVIDKAGNVTEVTLPAQPYRIINKIIAGLQEPFNIIVLVIILIIGIVVIIVWIFEFKKGRKQRDEELQKPAKPENTNIKKNN